MESQFARTTGRISGGPLFIFVKVIYARKPIARISGQVYSLHNRRSREPRCFVFKIGTREYVRTTQENPDNAGY